KALRHHHCRKERVRSLVGPAHRTRAAPPDRSLRQGRACPDVGWLGRGISRCPKGRPSPTNAGTDRPQTEGEPCRRSPRRSWALPPRGRPPLDRHDGGPSARLVSGGASMSQRPLPVACPSPAGVLEARDVCLSFGETPALRGATL